VELIDPRGDMKSLVAFLSDLFSGITFGVSPYAETKRTFGG
jgi:hypothetical protein